MPTFVKDREPPGTVTGGGAVTPKGKETELEKPRASVAVTVIRYVPTVVAVPVSNPPVVSEKFGGNPETENE